MAKGNIMTTKTLTSKQKAKQLAKQLHKLLKLPNKTKKTIHYNDYITIVNEIHWLKQWGNLPKGVVTQLNKLPLNWSCWYFTWYMKYGKLPKI